MKKKFFLIICCLLLIGSMGLASCGGGDRVVPAAVRTAEPYYSLGFDFMGDDVMPLGGWWGVNNQPSGVAVNGLETPDFINDDIFQMIKDAGINFQCSPPMGYPVNKDDIYKALDLGDKYGIGYFVAVNGLNNVTTPEAMESIVGDLFSYPSCLGMHMKDEPSATDFVSLAGEYKLFSQTTFASDKYLRTNLFPSRAGASLGGAGQPLMNYYDYLTQFVQMTGTKFLSYDNYAWWYGSSGDTTTSVESTYFSDLSTVRKVANENHIPFWVFVQAGAQWDSSVGQPSLPLFPNEGETLWNINSSLAYGAKGIQYFCMIQPSYFADAGNGNEDFQRNSLIGAAGNKTQWYYYIQKANKQIAAISPILMKSAHMGVLATGYYNGRLADIPAGSDGTSWRELTGIKSTVSDGVIVGCFDHNFAGNSSRSAFYVVNTSSTEKQKVTLSFDKNYGYEVIQRGVTALVTGKDLTLTLETGEGVMVALR